MNISVTENEELSLRECQLVELALMKDLHEYCTLHSIRYVIGYGTLLGAVRHRGFIPWDNDFDILMPRPDYERFLDLVKDVPISPNAYVLNSRTDANFHYSCSRVCDARTTVLQNYTRKKPAKMGLWIDVFPVDGIWEDSGKRRIARIRLRFHQTMQKMVIYKIGGDHGIVHSIGELFNKMVANDDHRFERKLDEIAMSCPYGSTEYVADTTEVVDMYPCLTPSDFDNPITLDFEDAKFYAPQNWDLHLKANYGNYLELPPEKDRVPHNFRAFWIN